MDLEASRASGAVATSAPAFNAGDLFWNTKGSDYSWTSSFNLNFNPASSINNHLLTFEVPRLASPNCAFLGDAVLQMQLILEDKDGLQPKPEIRIAPINLFTSGMFRSVRVFLNEVEVSSSEMGAYFLRCYMSELTGLDSSSKVGHAQTYGWYRDFGGEFQNPSATNPGFFSRMLLFGKQEAGGNITYKKDPTTCYTRLWTDFSSCSLPIVPDVGIRLELVLQDPAFYLHTSDKNAAKMGYRLKISAATLILPVKTLATGLALDLEKKLAEKPITYPLGRVESKMISIPASLQNFSTDKLTQSSLNPDRVAVILIAAQVWNPNYLTNPLEFSSRFRSPGMTQADLIRAALTVNGQPVDQEPCNGNEQLAACAFRMLYKNLGQIDRKGDCAISLNEFNEGYFFLLYDLTASGRAANSGAKQPARVGNLRLDLHFSAPLPFSINCFITAEYGSSIMIDKNRSVKYNFIA